MKVTIELSPDLLAWISDNAEHAGRARKTEIEHMLRGCMAKGLDASQLPFPRTAAKLPIEVAKENTPDFYINSRGETITDPNEIERYKWIDAEVKKGVDLYQATLNWKSQSTAKQTLDMK